MAQQVIFLGTNPNDATGESAHDGGSKINNNFTELYALNSDTINAGAVAYNFTGATNEQRIALADADAVLLGKARLFIPSSLLPYSISLCPASAGVQRVREGGTYSVYDVRAYGAAGNDVMDDSLACATALQHAATNNSLCFIPVGTYAVSTAIAVTMGSLLEIVCDGILHSTVSGSGVAVIKITGDATSRLILRGLVVQHTFVSGTTLMGLSIPIQLKQILAENIIIEGLPYYGADCTATNQTWVNSRFANNLEAGLACSGPGSIGLINLDIDNNGPGTNTSGYGVVISGGSGIISGGRFVDNDRYGIDGRRSDNLVIDGAYIFNSGLNGIYAVNEDSEKDTRNIKILGCTVDMNNRASSERAIWVGAFGAGGVTPVNEVTVRDCTVKNGLDTGILVSAGTGTTSVEKVVVTGNQLETITGAAIRVDGITTITSAIVGDNILKNTGNIIINGVTRVAARDNIYRTSSSVSSFIAVSGDSYTEIVGNISDAIFTAAPFTWSATRYVVKDNIAIWGAQSRELLTSKAAIPDNSATTFLNVSVPNIEIGGRLLIDYGIVDEDKGDHWYTGQLIVQIVRYPGVAAQVTIGHSVAQQNLSTASGWGRTSTVTFSTAVSGAVGATNTVAIKVTSDQSDNLTSFLHYHAQMLHSHKTGTAFDMTLVAA